MTGSPATVHLVRGADRATQLDALAAEHGGRVGLGAVLDDLNRQAVHQIMPVSAADYGFRWNDGDCDTEEWWPQGISTSADATDTYEVHGRRIVVVSWYAKPVGGAPSRGSRVSFVDVTSMTAAPRYRHVLLVQPWLDKASDTWSLQPVRVHAGGIAWRGDVLYVADTNRGVRCFEPDDIIKVSAEAFDGYRYVLPQRTSYKAVNADGVDPFRFSFLALDRGADPAHRLVVGEYGRGQQTTRLASFEFESEANALALTDDQAHPLDWITDGPTNMQGAVAVGDTLYISTSRGTHKRGTMWTITPGKKPREHKATLAVGPEDLAYWPGRDEIWGVSEHPGRRYVYAMPRSAFD